MSIVTQPDLLSGAFAYDGDKNIIPANNDGTSGLASIAKGFPPITQQPLASGGIPPQRADFNGIFNLITSFLTYIQSGGVFAYSSTLDYDVSAVVKSNGNIYQCIKQNGPGTSYGVQNVDNDEYWLLILNANSLLNANVTVTDDTSPASDTASLQTMLSYLAYMIKAITGKSDWKSSPAINIATLISQLSTGSDVSWSGSKFTNSKLGISGLMAQNGYIQFGPNFGGLIVQWGLFTANPTTASGIEGKVWEGSFAYILKVNMAFNAIAMHYGGSSAQPASVVNTEIDTTQSSWRIWLPGDTTNINSITMKALVIGK